MVNELTASGDVNGGEGIVSRAHDRSDVCVVEGLDGRSSLRFEFVFHDQESNKEGRQCFDVLTVNYIDQRSETVIKRKLNPTQRKEEGEIKIPGQLLAFFDRGVGDESGSTSQHSPSISGVFSQDLMKIMWNCIKESENQRIRESENQRIRVQRG